MIDWGWILGAVQWASHHIVALRTVSSAHVLNYADVSTFNDDVSGVVVSVETWPEMRAVKVAGESRGVIRSAGQQDWCSFQLRAFRDQEHCVELHPVAHRNHDFAARV